jgi:oligosaccharide repeat unit polymerase
MGENIVEPVMLFSIYNILTVFTIWYLILTDMKETHFISHTHFYSNKYWLLSISSFYLFVGNISMLLGYFFARKCYKIQEDIIYKYDIHSVIANIFIIALILIGLLNYLYNYIVYVKRFTLINIYHGALLIQENSTTLGYTLAQIGLYIYLIEKKQNNQKLNLFSIMLCMAVVFLRASKLRVIETLCLMITIFFLVKRPDSKKSFLFFSIIGIIGIVFYYMRMFSSISPINRDIRYFFDNLVDYIQYGLFYKGNTPNIAIMMKVIDSWGRDIGYMYGKSFLIPFGSIFPRRLFRFDSSFYPVFLAKETWYKDLPQGGAYPMPGISEMYANFSIGGPIMGMFLFGIMGGVLYNWYKKRTTYLKYLIYLNITLTFFMFYPKIEFSNLNLLEPTLIFTIFKILKFLSKKIV